tara:strand:- start:292 stop:1377 length:1086 start_codon:yes stop_codon:yes gene_type:complete
MTRAVTLAEIADGAVLTADSSTSRVGIGSTLPTAKLDVVGVVSATSFFGDGSGLIGVASTDNIITSTASTFSDINTRNITGVGATLSGRIVGAAVSNVIPFYFANLSDLPSAVTYHGAFAHVHATGKGYFAHGGAWIELVNKETSGITGTGSENYNVGVITATQFSGNATGLTGTPDINVRNIIGVGATFSGVLTYEDVTNIDSIGIVTARSGIKIGPSAGVGGTFATDGSYITAGIITAGSYRGDGSALTGISAGISTAAGTAAGIVTTLLLSSAQDHKITASGITTITCSGGTEGDSHTVRIINSGITTVGFSTFFLFPSGNPPFLPQNDGAISLISFTVNRVGAGGTQLLAGASVNFS